MIRPRALLVLLTALQAPATAAAASPAVRTDYLQSRLVSEATAAVPGTRLTLGLLLEHDPHWHTYWRNPGDSGLPTVLELTLPDGVVAEPIAWPHPQRFVLSDIVNFGYGDRRLLPVSITIPADYAAPTLPVQAAARWLICELECIPGKAEYAFELPVASTAAIEPRWAEDFAAARRDLPRDATATLAVAEESDAIALTLGGLDAAALPAQWQWFPETPEIVANGAQPQWQRTAGGWQAHWQKSEYFNALPAEVVLVAVDGDGAAWRFVADTAEAAGFLSAAASPATASPSPPAIGIDPPLGLLAALLFAFIGGLFLNPDALRVSGAVDQGDGRVGGGR
jgi:DsbC/DsbD-like thiol-disulfide interchange protein